MLRLACFACFVLVKLFVFVRAILSFVHGALKLDPFYIICYEHLVNFYIQNNQGYGLVVEILMVVSYPSNGMLCLATFPYSKKVFFVP